MDSACLCYSYTVLSRLSLILHIKFLAMFSEIRRRWSPRQLQQLSLKKLSGDNKEDAYDEPDKGVVGNQQEMSHEIQQISWASREYTYRTG